MVLRVLVYVVAVGLCWRIQRHAQLCQEENNKSNIAGVSREEEHSAETDKEIERLTAELTVTGKPVSNDCRQVLIWVCSSN